MERGDTLVWRPGGAGAGSVPEVRLREQCVLLSLAEAFGQDPSDLYDRLHPVAHGIVAELGKRKKVSIDQAALLAIAHDLVEGHQNDPALVSFFPKETGFSGSLLVVRKEGSEAKFDIFDMSPPDGASPVVGMLLNMGHARRPKE